MLIFRLIKNNTIAMFSKKLSILILTALITSLHFSEKAYSTAKEEFYEIKIYHLQNKAQEDIVDSYLKNALLPAMHRYGITRVGVFKPLGNDTAKNRLIYVLVPYKTEQQFIKLPGQLEKDKQYNLNGQQYLNAAFDNTPYQRIESILLKAFTHQPVLQLPDFKNTSEDKAKRIYELRSYEGPTEKLYRTKVHMFNEGGEIEIFRRLGFNPVFFGSVLIGSSTPNLMYMTSFENMASHDAHWQAFRIDPAWKKLSSMDYYKHNVSKSTIILLNAASYSDI